MNSTSTKNKKENSKSRNEITPQMAYIYNMLRRFFLLILSILGLYIVVKTLILSYDEIKLRLRNGDLNPPKYFKPFNGSFILFYYLDNSISSFIYVFINIFF